MTGPTGPTGSGGPAGPGEPAGLPGPAAPGRPLGRQPSGSTTLDAPTGVRDPGLGAGRRRSRRLVTLAGAAGAVAGLAYLSVADPHDPATAMPGCPIRHVTGLDCPACGTLRLVHDLLHGRLGAAVQDNLFVLAVSPLLLYLLLRQVRAVRRGELAPVPRPLAYGLAAAAGVWMLVRNLPGWPLTPTSGP